MHETPKEEEEFSMKEGIGKMALPQKNQPRGQSGS